MKYCKNILQRELDVRVRFAPSPTGSLHLGGLRTAFYNWIFAKQRGGKFILRIEDTDQSRIVDGAANEIESVLSWANLRPDESPTLGGKYGPYTQSLRLKLYKDRANELLESGRAYRCFCSPMRLELLRKYQARNREKPRYDGKCKNLCQSEIEEKLSENDGQHVIRFSLKPGLTTFNDLIFGRISNNLVETQESDPVILKSDHYPTYHFANVIDDHGMQISHVLRGCEWISSTTKHIQLYHAFGWTEPNFIHFPLITMKDGSKMSKRNNQSNIEYWKGAGFRPLALLNFLTNMGGGVPKEKQDALDLWDLETLVKEFNFDRITCHPGSVDLEKLRKYNAKDLKKSWQNDQRAVLDEFKRLMDEKGVNIELDDNQLTRIISKFIPRIVALNEMLCPENSFIWKQPILTWSLKEYIDKGLDMASLLDGVIVLVNNCDLEDKDLINSELSKLAEEFGVDKATMMKFLRKIITNSEIGLPVYELFHCLGKCRLLKYLERGLKFIN